MGILGLLFWHRHSNLQRPRCHLYVRLVVPSAPEATEVKGCTSATATTD